MAVALRYGSDVATLRRLNNLPLSELSVQSRANIYIPGEPPLGNPWQTIDALMQAGCGQAVTTL